LPNIKSAKKRVLVSKLRQERNKANKTALKSVIKKARAEGAGSAELKNVIIALDKSVTKGIVHKNKAARLKSRLTKQIASV
jgi:small subunit ribosomal protein S20